MKINIANVTVDNITRQETLDQLKLYVQGDYTRLVVTTYSEFIVFAQRDSSYRNILNNADLSLPDGIGVIWAAKFLSLPVNQTSGLLKRMQLMWQVVFTGASLIFNPSYCRTVIKELVTGRELIWDIARIASDNNLSLALIGGQNQVAEKAAAALKQKFPGLKINLSVSDESFDAQMVSKIAASNSDILLIAYQPPKQETWLAQNLQDFNVKLAMGLGGTFDYLAGKRLQAPKTIHYLGLEWLWRLVTQPWRVFRIWNAIVVFIGVVYKFKLKRI